MSEEKPAEAAAQVADPRAPGEAAAAEIGKVIDQWFADNFHGSLISRDAEHYAQVFRAKEKLKELLMERKE